MEEIRLVRWNDCVVGVGVLGFQTPAKILVRQLAPDQPKQKAKSKTYGYGCKGVASNGNYGRILSTLVSIIGPFPLVLIAFAAGVLASRR